MFPTGGLGLTKSVAPTVVLPTGTENEIKIPDVVELVRQLLVDPLRNHKLTRIVDADLIFTMIPTTWKNLPAIYIKKIGHITEQREEELPSGNIGEVWKAEVLFEIVTSRDSYTYYPVPGIGESPPADGSTKMEGAEKVLNTIAWLIDFTLSENRVKYELDTDATFHWDDVKQGSYQLVDGGYRGSENLWAILVSYMFDLEVETRDG